MRVLFVSIIVPAKNAEKTIKECLDSLIKLDYPKNMYEIILVIDKSSKDNTEKIAKKYRKKIKIVKSKKIGSAANRNLGVSKVSKKAKYFAFTDSDCYVAKDWLRILVKRMEKVSKDVGCVGGLNLIPASDNKTAHLIGAIESTLLGGGGSAQSTIIKKERVVASIPNCNALYRRKLWEENKQDESLIVGQDGEFNYRLWKKGVKFLVTPKAKVWHHRPSKFRGYLKRMFKYGEATGKIFRKHKGILKVRWYSLLPVMLIFGVILLLILSVFNFFFIYMLSFGLLVYVLLLLYTTIDVLFKSKLLGSLLTPLILFVQHISYGFGLLMGVLGG